MEILTTIWNALTVENEVIVTLSFVPMIFIEIAISMLLFTTVLDISFSKSQAVKYIVYLSIIGIITHLFLPEPFNTFINIIACPIFVMLIFKTNLLKAILAEIIQFAAFIIVGSLLINIYLPILRIPIHYIKLIPIYKMCYSSILYLSVYLIYKLLDKFNINILVINNMNKKKTCLLLTNLIIGIIVIYIQSKIIDSFIAVLPYSLVILSTATLSMYFIISIYSLLRTTKLEITSQNLEEQKLYNKTLTILYDNVRGFKHDFNNIVQTIGGYISADNMTGLKNYYSELLKDCTCINNLTILNPEVLNNPAIYSILTYKYHKAEDLGIKVNLDVFLDLSTLNINTYEFTKILGILLDNAIEASSNSTEKVINITIRKDLKVNRNLFIIENSYSNKNVNIDEIFEKGYTSKNKDLNNHGLGLWEVRKILRKSKNINLYTAKTNDFFKQQLEIYNEKL